MKDRPATGRPSAVSAGKTVLVLGSGGREHALAWKLSLSPRVARVIVAPGNDAWPASWERWPDVQLGEKVAYVTLASRARDAQVDLAVIGPDNPLADGLANVLVANGIETFGPAAAAARIEASKSFAKDVMQAAGVPTARYFKADSAERAREVLEELERGQWGSGWVIKCDGLALGKGVRVCATPDEAFAALADLSKTASTFVIEEKLSGEELSWMAFCDGKRCALLEPARDHKRLRDRDEGPNTGGMGAFSPVPGYDAAFGEKIRSEVFLPVLAEMENRETPFRGVLYAGLMVDRESGRYWVLEFNARFGDPEAQVLLARMDDDLYSWCEAVARGNLAGMPASVPFSTNAAVVIVGAAAGYPENPERGKVITFPGDAAAPRYFWAGVKRAGSHLVSSGGRVFGAVGQGKTLIEARQAAYRALDEVSFAGMQVRRDIAENGGER